jgi:hypothetical protein
MAINKKGAIRPFFITLLLEFIQEKPSPSSA